MKSNRKLNAVALITASLLFSPLAIANSNTQPEPSTDMGYSYFSFGIQNVDYEERQEDVIAGLDIPFKLRTEGSVSSLNIRSGGLFHINGQYDFSIDSTATFAPEYDEETWYLDINLPGVQEGEEAVQHNSLSFTDASTTGLIHYKVTNNWRVVAGAEFQLQQFKRNEFYFPSVLTQTDEYADECVVNEGEQRCLLIKQSEEIISNINTVFGLAYESGVLSQSKFHNSMKLTVGYTAWSHIINSDSPELEFNDTGKYTIMAEARSTYQISDGLNLGVYANLQITERGDESVGPTTFMQGGVEKTKVVSVPEATTTSIALGVTAAWDL